MAGGLDSQTLNLQSSLNQAARILALKAIQDTGRALPCRVTAVSGSIVTVSFEVTGPQTLPPLTLPKAESQWMRSPTQVGDYGLTVPADVSLGAISGLGGNAPSTTTQYGNMTSLVWVPVASTAFQASPDPNKAWIYGPDGVVLSNTEQTLTLVLDTSTNTIIAKGNGTAVSLALKSDVQNVVNTFDGHIHPTPSGNSGTPLSTSPEPVGTQVFEAE